MIKLLLFGFFFFILLVTLLYNKIKITKQVFYTVFCILLGIVIYRPQTMPDYLSYVNAYNEGAERFEPFYQVLYGILHFFSQPYTMFFIAMAILTVGLKWYAIIRISDYPFLSLLVWMSQILIAQDMIAVRAALAASLLLWILWFKYNGEVYKMWMTFCLSVCCHYSAIVFFIVPFLSSTKPRKILYIGGLLLSAYLAMIGFSLTDFLGFIAIAAISDLSEGYQNQSGANAFNLLQIIRCCLCLVLWWKIDYLQTINSKLLIFLKTYTVGCVIFFLTWKLVSVAFRLGELFWVSEIIIYPYLMYIFGRKFRKVYKLIPIAIAALLFFINFTNQDYWNPV